MTTKIRGVAMLLAFASLAAPAFGDDLADTMRAWCSQAGTWRGDIDITDAQGRTQKVALVSRHRCTPDGRVHIVEEDFLAPGRSDHTVKNTWADPAIQGFRTAYFARGAESPHVYRFAAVAIRDPQHWSQSIRSTDEGEVYEGRKAMVRYTRERDGDRLVSRKEVRFLDAPGDFETRSLIVQQRVADAAPAGGFSVVEASLGDLQAALRDGRVSSRGLVSQYLARIALHEDRINATLAVNPRALEQADELDRERAAGRLRGPLHGIPVALKDNIHADGMPITAGTLRFEGFVAPYEATLAKNLRDAGAIIIAKTVMTEMANWMVIGMPNNYSSLGGYAFNPYDPRRDPRPGLDDGRPVLATGSSSSGSGTALSLWAANVGTETTVSIIGPASAAMLAAIKPTVGRISRHGIVPVTLDQDTAGPMTRSVTDAAVMLGALEGEAPDPADPATTRCPAPPGRDYTPFLKADALRGARIGVPRAWFVDAVVLPGESKPSGGIPEDQKRMLDEAVAVLRARGAIVVDAADPPSVLAKDPARNAIKKGSCSQNSGRKGADADCSVVLKYGFKRDFTAWLASLGASAPVRSLVELREWNLAHASAGTLKYGQTSMDISDEQDLDSPADRARYEADRARELRLVGAEGVDALMKRERLDALLFVGSRGSGFLAKPGYPSVVVPFGLVANGEGFPPGFTPNPAPLGIAFGGVACSEPRLIALAYAFEQATLRRRPPPP
jgi:amidase